MSLILYYVAFMIGGDLAAYSLAYLSSMNGVHTRA